MSSPDYSQAVKDIIDGLGDSPTPDAIYHAVRSYSVDHVVAAAAAAAKAGGGGGGGGSQPITRAQYDLALTGVADNVPLTKLPFSFNYGTELLDVTSPTNPTPAESGTYSFAVTVSISNLTEATVRWTLAVLVDEDDFGAELAGKYETTTATGSNVTQSLTLPFYVPAGSPCFVRVQHDNSAGADFSGHCYVQRFT